MELGRALKTLCDAGVDFIIVGGVAATFHGSAQVTFDLGICYSRSTDNLDRLAKALAPFHPRPRGFPDNLPFIWDETTLRNGSLFTLTTQLGDIDLLGEVKGLGTFTDLNPRAVMLDAHGCRVRTIDLRSLIQAKRAAGREKDLRALPELEGLLDAEDS
jgi:predicted nucleotidyltransferase